MNDRAIAAALAALVLAARLPFESHALWAWNSVLFARALEQGFHVDAELSGQRPYPPGYIFYIASAALVRPLVGDSNAALVAVSVIASALCAAAVYLLCRRFAGRTLSLTVALGAAFAPLAWTFGEVAMPYAVLGLLSIAVAAAFRAARSRAWPAAPAASLAFGLASGYRQDLLLVLGPLWLWLVVSRSWRERAWCAAALGAGCLAWIIPTALLSGGPVALASSLGRQAAFVGGLSPAGGGADTLVRNTLLTVYSLWWGLLGFAFLFIAALIAGARARLRAAGETTAFFVLWIAPAALLYALIQIGGPGYLLSILPALYVACAALLARAAGAARPAAVALAAALAAVNAGVFLVSDAPFSAQAIATHDRSLEERVTLVRDRFPPQGTVILAQVEYLTARYYLPEYRVLFYGAHPEALARAAREVRVTAPTTVVVFGALTVPLPATFRLNGDDPVRWGGVDPASALVAHDLEPP